MKRAAVALVGVALASVPVCEVAYALPHRFEPPFVVVVLCLMALLRLWVRGELVDGVDKVVDGVDWPEVVAPARGARPATVCGQSLVLAYRQVAADLCRERGSVTADDLRAVAVANGEALSAGVLAHVFRKGFREIGRTRSENPANKGRSIGVYALGAGA